MLACKLWGFVGFVDAETDKQVQKLVATLTLAQLKAGQAAVAQHGKEEPLDTVAADDANLEQEQDTAPGNRMVCTYSLPHTTCFNWVVAGQ